jgi:nucleoid-associated protein YgaU
MQRMVVPIIASVATIGLALVFAIPLLHRDPLKPDNKIATVAASKPATLQSAERALASSHAGARSTATLPDDRSPTFDIARIEPSGDAVVAGRAVPNSTVELLEDGKVHGRALANGSGEFVIVPLRLPPGVYRLALRSTETDGKQVISKQTISVSVNPPVDNQPATANTEIANPPQQTATEPVGTAITLDSVKLERDGVFHVSGRAEQGASVKLYLNDSYLASATLGADRHFSFTINEGLTPGNYRVRLDAIATDSSVVKARLQVPLQLPGSMVASATSKDRAEAQPNDDRLGQKKGIKKEEPAAGKGPRAAVVVPKVWTAAVARGDSLWRISRSSYGDGHRYPSIFEANRTKIRNPDLIYPGQIFVLPKK